ncbi:UDP-N-acetylmuramate:L-alanyl-gamma-D-glutamyl-meso-diaminopimelate ligase [Pseudofulvimonas gallinarii]|jgi:UDP-N-acetylmuramate: L-alanyl-gamma-D-glutamyl-meso-diaminopimelate ligase|uniref:UDP-N-acetylmuramate--L-alanyl-gamma-D-glutamyl-meso-2,6-diaminoheptandioate ligase n=1 Tax=Pseudofulvimonas gallinarii TaxID=634155 RepID=A0A4S3KZ01_9GAMM|nr:UDP-N-acetylmuramate:L-alanyl-gamma-D-glutamyl-meso-diaminopimelate ligase [Pseudofulvimonas gallinarii]TCS96202.1 UDP-N-acetylmuramate--L-alanine ligase [Pseudofulvimonas gallinarii]THD14632.1 UDP-N-acetylmuramate:L-alanyl-gamma-D-glutamyl-meso-diaminopimelate ligase [Pseudofulvimonas gallinarii]
MTLHILGICGTFMAGVAALARELGMDVEGSDAGVYPPMSDQLRALGIRLHEGYVPGHIAAGTRQVLIGNALSRGNPAVEHVLDAGLPYDSGAHWLGDRVLTGRPVLAVAGTHGKTTTSSLLAWILDQAGLQPGFLIGGVPENFGVSARLGAPGAPFVVEADEYDTAFFDKRAKFVHYRPLVAVLNNLEFDHADIYPDLAAIERQFHHLVRTVPGRGRLVVNAAEPALDRVLAQGCWTPVARFGIDRGDWQVQMTSDDGAAFRVRHEDREFDEVRWSLLGRHNVLNALAAVAAAAAIGVDPALSLRALPDFRAPKRRMEHLGTVDGVTVFDDFAHHPTAIATTLAGLRASVGNTRVIVALEPRSNSMRLGVHAAQIAPSLADADRVVFLARPGLPWDTAPVLAGLSGRGRVVSSADALLSSLLAEARPGDTVVFMSNGGFDAVQRRFVQALRERDG